MNSVLDILFQRLLRLRDCSEIVMGVFFQTFSLQRDDLAVEKLSDFLFMAFHSPAGALAFFEANSVLEKVSKSISKYGVGLKCSPMGMYINHFGGNS